MFLAGIERSDIGLPALPDALIPLCQYEVNHWQPPRRF
jgi:hypothetical protein